MNTDIYAAFIADDGYVMPTVVAVTSLIEHANKEYQYHVYIIMPCGCEQNSKDLFERLNPICEHVDVIVKEVAMGELSGLHKFDNARYLMATETALLKFRIAEIFSDLEKLLYLDGDILVRDDLTALYETELGENLLGAVRDLPQVLYPEQTLGAEIGRDYFNSGVMLLNLSRIREENIGAALLETKKCLKDRSLMDQNVFNIVCRDRVLQLPFWYNVCYINWIESAKRYRIEQINELYHTQYRSVHEVRKDIKIVHFSSKLKPWLFYDVPMADEWLYYYKKSIIGNLPLQRVYHTERNVDVRAVGKEVEKLSQRNVEAVIPVVFAANDKYAPYAAAAIQSIHDHASEGYFYDIHMMVDSKMPETIRQKFRRISYGNMSITMWDVTNIFKDAQLYSVGHYSEQMYYRWLIPELFSLYDKVIYLDCDVIVNRDLAELYETDIKDHYIGAVHNFLRSNLKKYVTERLGLLPEQYYNSGVLIINSREWLRNDIKKKCLAALNVMGKLACPDQDVINVVCKNRIYRLDDRWNFQWHHQFPDAVAGEFLEDYEKRYRTILQKGSYIVHYTSSFKAWNCPERAYAEIFWEYCKKTVFYESILLNGMQKPPLVAAKAKQASGSSASREEALRRERDDLAYQLSEIRKSKTYRPGRLFTFLPRLLRHMVTGHAM